MCGLQIDSGGRKERTQELVCFGIRASTGESPQMRDALDILSRFTLSSHCVSAGMVSVTLCDTCISVCLHIMLCMSMSMLYMHAHECLLLC